MSYSCFFAPIFFFLFWKWSGECDKQIGAMGARIAVSVGTWEDDWAAECVRDASGGLKR